MPVSPLIANPYACARTNAVPARTATKQVGGSSGRIQHASCRVSLFAAVRRHRAGRRTGAGARASGAGGGSGSDAVRYSLWRGDQPIVPRKIVDAARPRRRSRPATGIWRSRSSIRTGDLVYFSKMDHTQCASITSRSTRPAPRPPSDVRRVPSCKIMQTPAGADLHQRYARRWSLARRRASGRRRQDHRRDRLQRRHRPPGPANLQGRRRYASSDGCAFRRWDRFAAGSASNKQARAVL